MAHRSTAFAIAAIALAAFLFLGFYVIDAGVDESRHTIDIDNESFAPVGGEIETFNNSNLARADYSDSATVRNETSGNVMPESGNYTWFSGNGTLRVTTNSRLANGTAANVSYSYVGQTLRQTALTNIIIELSTVLVPLGFIAFVGFLAAALFIIARWV